MSEPLRRPAEPARATWLRLMPVIVCCGLMSVAYGYTMPAFALVMEHRGVATWLIGANSGSQNLVIILAGGALPRLLRATGIRRAMVLGILAGLASVLALIAVDPPYAWFPFRMLAGFSFYVAFIGGETWLSQESGDALRGRVIGAYGSACASGLFAGPLLVQWTGTSGLTPFLVAAGLTGAALVPLAFLRSPGPDMDEPARGGLLGYLRLVPVVMAASLLYGVIDQALLALLPVYGLHAGLGESRAVLLLTVWIAGAITLQIPMGRLSDRFGRRRVMIGCGATALTACVAIPFLIPAAGPGLWIVLAICGAGVMGLWTVSLAALGDRFRGTELATAATVYAIAYALGASAGPSIAGAGMEAWDPHGLMVTMGVVAAGFMIFAVHHALRHGWRERDT